MRLIDSHAHLLSEGFDDDREVLLGELAEQMEAIMECVSAPQDFPRVAELVQVYPFLYGAVGVHPEEIAAWSNQAAEQIAQYLHCPKIQAVGEIGLDYHWQPETAPLQKQALVTQLELARSANKPVILHNREATADLYDILQAHRGLRGVVHCFVDGPEIARKAMDLGYYLGFGGVITFKNAGAAARSGSLCADGSHSGWKRIALTWRPSPGGGSAADRIMCGIRHRNWQNLRDYRSSRWLKQPMPMRGHFSDCLRRRYHRHEQRRKLFQRKGFRFFAWEGISGAKKQKCKKGRV